MKKTLRKLNLSITILTIITLTLVSTNILMVYADAGGTGKYLTVDFRGEGSVDADKVQSGETWTFIPAIPAQTEKVGAGTVRLTATASSGWVFSHWEDDVTGTENPTYYKTRKGGWVTAVFDRISWDVTASVVSGLGTITGDGDDLGNGGTISVYHGESATFEFYPSEGYYVSNVVTDGTIVSPTPIESHVFGPIMGPGHSLDVEFDLLTFDVELSVVDISGEIVDGTGSIWYDGVERSNPATITVDWGSKPTLEFIPADTYHLSSILVDNANYVDLVLSDFTESYEFEFPIKEAGHSVAVTFSEDGRADIPAGSDVTVFLSSAASLTFDNVGEGSALGGELTSPDPNDIVLWEITVVAELGNQIVVALKYDPAFIPEGIAEEDLRMFTSDLGFDEYLLYLRVDFNGDGVIDGQDVKQISNLAKHPKFLPPEGTPEYLAILAEYDLDIDGDIDEDDIHIVNSLKNVEWTDITLEVDTDNNIIYGLTDHFSIFRCR